MVKKHFQKFIDIFNAFEKTWYRKWVSHMYEKYDWLEIEQNIAFKYYHHIIM